MEKDITVQELIKKMKICECCLTNDISSNTALFCVYCSVYIRKLRQKILVENARRNKQIH